MSTEGFQMHEHIERLFRDGFLMVRNDSMPREESPLIAAIRARFKRRCLGSFTIFIADSAPYFTVHLGDLTFLVIGQIYDNDGDSPEEKIRQLAKGDLTKNLASIDLGGRYALLVINGNDFLVANDPFASRAVHYFKGSCVAVASHAALLAEYFNVPRDPEVNKFRSKPQFKKRTVSYLPGNITAYRSIRRLPANHFYSSKSKNIERYWPHLPRAETTEEEVFEIFERALRALHDHVKRCYTPVVSITGGVDSRSIVTAFHEYASSFIGITWTDVHFNTDEYPVVRNIVDVVGCRHFNVEKDCVDNTIRDIGAYNAGMAVSGLRAKLLEGTRIKISEQSQDGLPPLFIIGYGGEILRGFYRRKSRDPEQVFDIQAMLDLYSVGPKKSDASDGYTKFATRAFSEFFKDARFDQKALKGFDGNDIFYWEHRMSMWAALTMDTIDVSMPCLVGINSRRLYEAALSLPASKRMSGNLVYRYIKSRSPSLASIPVK